MVLVNVTQWEMAACTLSFIQAQVVECKNARTCVCTHRSTHTDPWVSAGTASRQPPPAARRVPSPELGLHCRSPIEGPRAPCRSGLFCPGMHQVN